MEKVSGQVSRMYSLHMHTPVQYNIPPHGEVPPVVQSVLFEAQPLRHRDEAGPEQIGIESEQRSSLWQTAKSCLGETQFTALWLFYVEDMPLVEIGKVMKRPTSWVKVNLMRARRRLSKELETHHLKPVVSRKEVTL